MKSRGVSDKSSEHSNNQITIAKIRRLTGGWTRICYQLLRRKDLEEARMLFLRSQVLKIVPGRSR